MENNGLSWSMATIWFCNEYKEYSGGGGIYVKRYNENNWKEIRKVLFLFLLELMGLVL